jgi:hypothetical protein
MSALLKQVRCAQPRQDHLFRLATRSDGSADILVGFAGLGEVFADKNVGAPETGQVHGSGFRRRKGERSVENGVVS